MKAITQHCYGAPEKVLQLSDTDQPQPGNGEVLLRVSASSINPAEWLGVTGQPYILRAALGVRRPRDRVPGRDVAGVVEAVGPHVTRFRCGDEVYGEISQGAYAEYAVASQNVLAHKPESLSFSEAAALPLAGVAAVQALRSAGGVSDGDRVLINGASGGVGTFAVQLSKAYGAHVTGVCAERNRDMVHAVGADETIDYTREDFTQSQQQYDVILDLVGTHAPSQHRRVLRRDGVYVCATGMPGGVVLGPMPYILRVLLTSLRGRPKMKLLAAKASVDDLDTLKRFVESGQLWPVIERSYSLAEVPHALKQQGAGHARGKKVVVIAS